MDKTHDSNNFITTQRIIIKNLRILYILIIHVTNLAHWIYIFQCINSLHAGLCD